MGLRLALLPGDGVGPEVVGAALRVLAAVEARFDFKVGLDEIPCGGAYYLEHGRDWPADAEARCDAADALLLGAVGWPDPRGSGPVCWPDGRMAGWSAVLGNRSRLDLYANVRPVRLFAGVTHQLSGRRAAVWAPEDVDLVIFRENTEGLYLENGGRLRRRGVAELATDVRIITRKGSERICRRAFERAVARRGKVTAVVKDNVLEGCRLFSEVFREVAEDFPTVEAGTMLVDTCAQALITRPEDFDVVVTTNLFGDILTDLAAVLQGGMGMATGANLGDERAMFEPVHGSAPELAGQDLANPIATILALADCLRWIGGRRDRPELAAAASGIEAAVQVVLQEGICLPRDLGGDAGTREVADAIAAEV